MYGLTKRICQFPGCGQFLPRRGDNKSRVYCSVHRAYNNEPDGWTHQLAWGVFSPKYYAMLMEDVEP